MRIRKLSARNIAGMKIDAEMAPVTVIAGGNYRGKTTHLNAMALALYGYVPGVAKKPNEVFERLATGSPLMAAVEFDGATEHDGSGIVRTWTESRGAVKYAGPKDEKFPPVMLDANEYFALSGPDRVKMLFARSSVDLTIEAVARSIVTNSKNIKLEPHTAPAEAAVQKLVALVNERATFTGTEVNQWIENVTAEVKASKLLAEQNERRLSATLAGMTQTADPSAAADPACEQKLAKAREALEGAGKELARLRQVLADLEKLERELAAASEKLVDVAVVRGELQELNDRMATEAAVPAPGDFLLVPTPEEEAAARALEKRVSALRSAGAGDRPSDAEALKALGDARGTKRQLREAMERAWTEVVRLEKLIEDAAHAKTCPTCGQSVEAHQKALADIARGALGTARRAHEEAEAKHSSFQIQNFELAADLAARRGADWDKAHADMRALEQEGRNLGNAMEKRCRDAWAKLNDEHREAQGRIAQMTADASVMNQQIANADSTNEAARAAGLKRDDAVDQIRATRSTIERWTTMEAEARGDVAKHEGEARRLTAERASARDRQRASEAADAAKAERDVFKQAVDMMGALQATILDKAVLPLLASCNDLCRDILAAPLAYRDGEIGMDRATGFVSHRTMSGSERAVAFCALSLALAAGSPMRLAVLDELGRLDHSNKARVVCNALVLVKAGRLDQAVFVDTDPDYYEVAFAAEIARGEVGLVKL